MLWQSGCGDWFHVVETDIFLSLGAVLTKQVEGIWHQGQAPHQGAKCSQSTEWRLNCPDTTHLMHTVHSRCSITRLTIPVSPGMLILQIDLLLEHQVLAQERIFTLCLKITKSGKSRPLLHFAFLFGIYTGTPAHTYTSRHSHTLISVCLQTHSSICMLSCVHTRVQTHCVHTHMLTLSHISIHIYTHLQRTQWSIGLISYCQLFPQVKKFLHQKHKHAHTHIQLKLFVIVDAIPLHLGRLEFD